MKHWLRGTDGVPTLEEFLRKQKVVVVDDRGMPVSASLDSAIRKLAKQANVASTLRVVTEGGQPAVEWQGGVLVGRHLDGNSPEDFIAKHRATVKQQSAALKTAYLKAITEYFESVESIVSGNKGGDIPWWKDALTHSHG